MSNKISLVAVAQYAALCAVGCNSCTTTDDFPVFATGLNTSTVLQRGGITALAFIRCDTPISDYTSLSAWNAAIVAGEAIVRSDCGFSASKDAEDNTVGVGACGTQITVSRRHTITFLDKFDNADKDVSKFYRHLQTHPTDYILAYFTCDGDLYVAEKATISVRKTIDETIEGFTQHQGTASWEDLQDPLPIVKTWTLSDIVNP